MTDFFLWAHRGASAVAPENTMAAFVAAEEAGAGGIELDVHLSRDGVPVVIHDPTLDRTTDCRGPVNLLSLDELRRCDAGSWFNSAFAGEAVPILAEVLEWGEGRLRLNVEIKSAPAALAVLQVLKGFPRSSVLVSSFDHRLLEDLRASSPDLPLGFLCDSFFWRRGLKRAAACGAESFHPRQDLASRTMIAACQRAGLRVYPYTVDSLSRMRALRRQGASGLFTNDPGGLAAGRA